MMHGVAGTSSQSVPRRIVQGRPTELLAGEYKVVVAYRRTATYLVVCGNGRYSGRTEMRSTTERDLEMTLSCGRAIA